MRARINIISFGKKAQEVMFRLRIGQKQYDYNLKIECKFDSITDENEDEYHGAYYYWEEWKRKYNEKKVEKLLNSGDINFIIAIPGMLGTINHILNAIDYKKHVPVYIAVITNNNKHSALTFKKWVKVKCFRQIGASEEFFLQKCSIQIDFLIEEFIRNRFMTFRQYMQSDLKKGDQFENYKPIYIPDFLFQK